MIPLRKQVTSLKLSKQLKKLGIKQDSLWYWEKRTFLLKAPDWLKDTNDITLVDCDYEKKENWKHYSFKYYSAFTVAELGVALPIETTSEKWIEDDGRFFVRSESEVYNTLENTEANARAKMLIWLIENKLMGANE